MNRFEEMIEVIFHHEGGYVNDPDDLGGETKYGITKRRYPDLDIKNLSRNYAMMLFNRDFYQAMGIYQIQDDQLALQVLDMGINAGKKTAVKLLQKLLIGITVDGFLGPVTETAINKAQMDADLVEAYKAMRIGRYYKISKLRNNQKFLKGWVKRVYRTKL